MPRLQVSLTSTKPRDRLWEVIADFPNIAQWFDGVKTSASTSDDERGIGATRHCALAPMGEVDERILEWEEGQRLLVAIERSSKAPMKTATADFTLTDSPEGITLGIDYEYVPKGGVLGKAASPAVTKQMEKGFTKMLESWDAAA